MDFQFYLVPGAATMAILGMVYLLFVYWARRPERREELMSRRDAEASDVQA